jgi:Flp pilus assembly protein TadD/predicted AlkP superfamily pyrophosphatase or phosphodiesterase
LLLSLLLWAALACGPETSLPEGARVLVLGLDGLDPQAVDLLMSEGLLPNFARLRQEGAYGRLRSQKPLLSPILWTTIATGKGPLEHGIGHFVARAPGSGEEIPASSELRRVKALWNIASEAGREVLTVGWWATWPPEEVRGSVVSDHTAYHFLFEDGFTGVAGETTTHPPELAARIAPRLRRPSEVGADELAPFVEASPEELAAPFDFQDDLAHLRWALATAESYRDIGLELWRSEWPDLGLVYIEGVDSVSHLFGHLFRAEGLGGELALQQQKYGRTVEQMYLFADRLVGEFLAALDDRTTLVVLSDHGFALGELPDDPSVTRDLRRVSEKFHRLEGILYLYGPRVRAHARIDRPSILDIAPTVLTLLGLPPARDMPGRVLAEALTLPPGGARVASYETSAGRVGPAAGEPAGGGTTAEDAVRRAQLEHLESLGYLGGSGRTPDRPRTTAAPEAERNRAALHFEAGRWREAAQIYRRLLEASPDDAALHTSLAGALGALGRFDQAFEELSRAIELDPLSVEAYHNRAVIWERRGEPAEAIEDYRRAVRYRPSYEPSRQALERLTGQADVRAPTSEAEERASALVGRAQQAARSARYDEALRLLAEAETAAPEYVLIYQYRANVAYLTGDRETAVAALEKALELEPDNALFQANLAWLMERGERR